MSSKHTLGSERAISTRHFRPPETKAQSISHLVEAGQQGDRHRMSDASNVPQPPSPGTDPGLGTPPACVGGMLSNAVKQPMR